MKLRLLPGALLMLSGVTHVTQLFVYDHEGHVLGAAAFGVLYFVLGAALVGSKSSLPMWASAIFPAVGGVLGTYRFFMLQRNPFSVFHVGLDMIVVPVCIYLLVGRRAKPHPPE